MSKLEQLRVDLDNLSYDKYYQDIEVLGFEGYSKSFETWDRISGLGVDLTNKSVCDLGCFHGYFSFKAEQAGAQKVVGLDQSPEIVGYSNKIKDVLNSNVEFCIWRGGEPTPRCDVALVLNMLHHCADIRATLANIDCEYAIFEVNEDQLQTIGEYFDIIKDIQGRVGGSGFRRILYAVKKRS